MEIAAIAKWCLIGVCVLGAVRLIFWLFSEETSWGELLSGMMNPFYLANYEKAAMITVALGALLSYLVYQELPPEAQQWLHRHYESLL